MRRGRGGTRHWAGRQGTGYLPQHAVKAEGAGGRGGGAARGQHLPVIVGGSGSGSVGPKKEGISVTVTGVLRQSSVERSKTDAVGNGDGIQSLFLTKASKPIKLNDTAEESAMVVAEIGSIPSIIIVAKFKSSSLEICDGGESSGCGLDDPEPDMVDGGTRERHCKAPSDHESASGAKAAS